MHCQSHFRGPADDGKHLPAMDVMLMDRSLTEESEERRYTSRFCPTEGWRIAPKSYIYICIYTKSQFLLDLYLAEVLERFGREILETESNKIVCLSLVFNHNHYKTNCFLRFFRFLREIWKVKGIKNVMSYNVF